VVDLEDQEDVVGLEEVVVAAVEEVSFLVYTIPYSF
jgi:hypothetical protein